MDHEESEVKSKYAVHFSSERQDHATPWTFFNKLDEEFGFTLDVCAEPHNAKCEHYFTPEIDGLRQPWTGVCWMNPPYGREIGKWVEKAKMAGIHGACVVCLLPARTDTRWFHDHVMHDAQEIRFVKGRIVFEGSTAGAPFPSMVVIYGPRGGTNEPTEFYAMPNYSEKKPRLKLAKISEE